MVYILKNICYQSDLVMVNISKYKLRRLYKNYFNLNKSLEYSISNFVSIHPNGNLST